MISIVFGTGGLGSAEYIALAGLILSGVTTCIAISVASTAKSIRTLDWYRSQNDAWNHYNAQKLGDSSADFEIVDRIITGQATIGTDYRPIDENLLDEFAIRSVLYQRFNILERDFKAVSLNLVGNADGHYLLNEIKATGLNAPLVLKFMKGGGYDPRFVRFYQAIAEWYALNPGMRLSMKRALQIGGEPSLPARVRTKAKRLFVRIVRNDGRVRSPSQ